MIITKTPFRMSFFGGGTDIPDFFNEYNGAVISTTFDKYCYVNVRHLPKFFDYKSEIIYSKIERIQDNYQIAHPMVRNAMSYLDMKELRITYDADLPARSGLGTSSSFAVGILSAFHSLKGHYVGKKKLAEEAIELERYLCNEYGGWQDQIAAAYGGLNKISFRDEKFFVDPIIITNEKKKKLNSNLMLFFTGFTRFSADVQIGNKGKKFDNNKKELLDLVKEAEEVLTSRNDNLNEFGKLLDYEWKIKKASGNNVSNKKIDDIYERGKKTGAIGGKLLGAGGGGFMLFYVEEDKQDAVKNALNDLLYVPFEFENEGSKVIYFSPEELYEDMK